MALVLGILDIEQFIDAQNVVKNCSVKNMKNMEN